MNNLNTVLVEGLLTRDPQRSTNVPERSVCTLSIANNRYYSVRRNGESEWVQDSSFFSVLVFGPVADTCVNYLRKGRGVRIVGRLKQFRRPEGGGLAREKIYIIAEHIEFQPEKKTDKEKIPEVEKVGDEFNTSANLKDLQSPPQNPQEAQEDQQPQEATVPIPDKELPIEDEAQTAQDSVDDDNPC